MVLIITSKSGPLTVSRSVFSQAKERSKKRAKGNEQGTTKAYPKELLRKDPNYQ
jgi:hypothetical protein